MEKYLDRGKGVCVSGLSCGTVTGMHSGGAADRLGLFTQTPLSPISGDKSHRPLSGSGEGQLCKQKFSVHMGISTLLFERTTGRAEVLLCVLFLSSLQLKILSLPHGGLWGSTSRSPSASWWGPHAEDRFSASGTGWALPALRASYARTCWKVAPAA